MRYNYVGKLVKGWGEKRSRYETKKILYGCEVLIEHTCKDEDEKADQEICPELVEPIERLVVEKAGEDPGAIKRRKGDKVKDSKNQINQCE